MKRKIEKELLDWKSNKDRKPLVLSGARQTGKTYILRDFAQKNYQNFVYVNLEANPAIASFFTENIAPDKIIRYLEASTNIRIKAHETLIILDEIQSCERALTALKYFYEEAPDYHIACAGSLLGVAINREKYSFPVGKVQSLTLYPFDFEEFLWATEQNLLAQEIRRCYFEKTHFVEALHLQSLEYYRLYLIIGGMPAVIKTFLTSQSLLDVPSIQNEIINNYIADMAKYASNSESVKIRACFNSIPAQLAKENKKFQYKIVQKGGSASLFGVAIDWLNFAGIVLKCQKIEQGIEPLATHMDMSSFKLYMSDVGLLAMKSGIAQQTILNNADNSFLGSLTENYVSQQLLANGHNLYYWESLGIAELDFILQKEDKIIAIEVKKGLRTKSKSLTLFIEKYQPAISIRLSSKNFGFTEKIQAIPLYAAFCI